MTHATRSARNATSRPSPRPRAAAEDDDPAAETLGDNDDGTENDDRAADSAEVSSADTSRDDEERPTARRDRRWLVTLIALTVVTLALLAGTTWLFFANRAADDMETDRGNVALAARQAVISLTSLSHQNAEQTYTRLLQGTTGDYRNQLSQQAGPFKDALTQGQVESSGQVLEAGVDKLDGATATALVVATANVKNTQAPQGENRQYRLHLTLQRQDGQWLVSNLEFVA